MLAKKGRKSKKIFDLQKTWLLFNMYISNFK